MSSVKAVIPRRGRRLGRPIGSTSTRLTDEEITLVQDNYYTSSEITAQKEISSDMGELTVRTT